MKEAAHGSKEHQDCEAKQTQGSRRERRQGRQTHNHLLNTGGDGTARFCRSVAYLDLPMTSIDHRWAHFVEAHWNLAPGVLHGWPARKLASHAEIVRGLERIARQHRSGPLSTGVHVYSGRGDAARDFGPWLPRPAEPAARYSHRIQKWAPPDGVVLAAEDFQVHSPVVGAAVRRFFEGLTVRIGAARQR